MGETRVIIKDDRPMKYFIVPESALGEYGDYDGSTKEEAESYLTDAGDYGEELVVIRGYRVNPTTKVSLP